MNKKIFNYPIYLLLFIIISKMLYLIAESIYNTIVLDVGIIKTPTKEIYDNLEVLGHNITSIGVTLLLFPLIYWIFSIFIKKETFRFFYTIGVSFLIYLSVYASLDYAIDYIIQKNKNQRYEAYYLNILKNGISNNILGHSDILDFNKGEDEDFSTEEKVIINNIFLLSYIDKTNIIRKMETVGMDNFLKYYKDKKYKNEFKQYNDEFMQLANKVKKLYIEYQKIQKKANKEYSKNINNAHGKYLEFTDSTKKSFEEYKEKLKQMEESIDKKVKEIQSGSFPEEWNRFAKYYNKGGRYREKALDEYNSKMQKMFNKDIPPSKWCESFGGIFSPIVSIVDGVVGNILRIFTGGDSYSGCLNSYAIEKIVSESYYESWKSKSKVPYNGIDTFEEYLLNIEVKNELITRLRKKDILVLDDFNYTEKEFRKAYISKLKKEIIKQTELANSQLGLHGIKSDLSFYKFTKSKQVKKLIQKKTQYKDRELSKSLNLIAKRKTEDYYKVIYLPRVINHLKEDIALTKKQLNTVKQDKGDDAIKSLYIPPIAISLSLIFGVLNAISLFALIIGILLVVFSNIVENRINIYRKCLIIALIVIVTVTPYLFKHEHYFNKFHNTQNILKDNTHSTVRAYYNVLMWIFVFEKYNYPIGKNARDLMSEKSLKQYGL